MHLTYIHPGILKYTHNIPICIWPFYCPTSCLWHLNPQIFTWEQQHYFKVTSMCYFLLQIKSTSFRMCYSSIKYNDIYVIYLNSYIYGANRLWWFPAACQGKFTSTPCSGCGNHRKPPRCSKTRRQSKSSKSWDSVPKERYDVRRGISFSGYCIIRQCSLY